MTGYADLPTSQIDADSALIEDTMVKLRDNPLAMFEGATGAPRLQTAAIQDAAVTNAKMAAAAIRQSNLNTSTGEVSITDVSNSVLTLPGGSYGFYPQTRCSSGFSYDYSARVVTAAGNTAYATSISLGTSGPITAYATQRYVNSSPPYNLGDGDVPVFVFALVDSSGQVVGTYTADVPPWAYNGPTSVMADAVDATTGKKYQRRKIMAPTGDIITTMTEVNDAIKNADMPLIPHPFEQKAGHSVVLLDPPETEELLGLHEVGESIADLLTCGCLMLDNTAISRAAPPGVMPVAIRWKNAQQKWRTTPAVAAKLQAMK